MKNNGQSIDLVSETICTIPQAAVHFGISKPSAWRKILTAEWPSFKIGKSRRTSIEAIARAIEEANRRVG